MDPRFKDKVVIVAAAGKGIGLAVTRALVVEGPAPDCQVAVQCHAMGADDGEHGAQRASLAATLNSA